MNMPENSSPLLRLKISLSPPNSVLKPRLIPALELATSVDAAAEFDGAPSPFFSVFHRTTNFSSPRPDRDSSESWGWVINPVRTIFSERMWSLTLPTRGTQPHATGAVQRAARYGTLPFTAGRWGWVDGKRWREMLGERIVDGRGWVRIFGRRGERVRRAVYC